MENVLTDVVGKVGVIRLNRARKHNAINRQMMHEVSAALASFEADDGIGAIVLCGAGPSFCAGFDLKELEQLGLTSPKDWQSTIQDDFEFVMQFWDCSKPTVSAIHGHCLGGGLELAVACDLTVANANANLGEPEMKFGSSIAALILPWLLPPKVAKEILLGAQTLEVDRAFDMGLINRICRDDSHYETALQLATEMASYSSTSVRRTKQAIHRAYDISGMRQALQVGVDASAFIEAQASATANGAIYPVGS